MLCVLTPPVALVLNVVALAMRQSKLLAITGIVLSVVPMLFCLWGIGASFLCR